MNTFKKLSSTSAAAALLIGATSFSPTDAFADQVILDDLIVDGSICVGLDCVNGESFGFDTLRLKENNLRIHFQDTSTSASFPTNDWRIVINSSSNGGDSFFRVEDTDAGRNPFTIEANADNNALYIDTGGRVGLSTNTPVVELHIKDGDTPTVRLEQDGSSGFTPQTWDLAGNETNFFVRDVTNSSFLPLRIRPGAPTNSIFVKASGDIGLGTDTPDGKLHTRGTSTQLVYFESTNGGAVQLRLRSDSTNRRFLAVNNNNETKSQIVFGDNEVKIAGTTDSGANLWATINASGITTQGATCNSTPCDGVFDPSVYEVESIEEHAEYMWSNKHLWGVGPTSPDKPFNITTKTAGILHELEKAHIYIEQLHERVKQLESVSGTE